MKESVPGLVSVIMRVQETFRGTNSSIKYSATLHNLTAYEPVLINDTRWTGNHDCLFQCIRMEDDLIIAHEDANSNFRMSTSV